MPARKLNFIHLHIEKLALGLSALVCIVLMVVFVIRTPNRAQIGGQTVTPANAHVPAEQAAQQLRSDMDQPFPDDVVLPVDVPRITLGPVDMSQKIQPLDATVMPWVPPGRPLWEMPLLGPVERVELPEPVIPASVRAYTGLTTVQPPDTRRQYDDRTRPATQNLSWVTVVSEIDMTALLQRYEALQEVYRDRPVPQPIFYRVVLERTEINPQGKPGKPQLIAPLFADLDIPLPQQLSTDPENNNFDIVEEYISYLRGEDVQSYILHPYIETQYEYVAGEYLPTQDEIAYLTNPPEQDTTEDTGRTTRDRRTVDRRTTDRRVPDRRGADRGDRRGGGRGGMPGGDMGMMPPDMGMGMPGGGMGDRRADRRMPGMAPDDGFMPAARSRSGQDDEQVDLTKYSIWCHDVTAIEGKTYIYRCRIVLVNPLMGMEAAVIESQDAYRTTIPGPWSSYTEPVTVKQQWRFFVTEVKPEDQQARVQVFKYHLGWWCDRSFMVSAGQPIGEMSRVEYFDPFTESMDRAELNFFNGLSAVDIRTDVSEIVEELTSSGQIDGFESQNTSVLVYSDMDGTLGWRSVAVDTESADYDLLRSKARQQRDALRETGRR